MTRGGPAIIKPLQCVSNVLSEGFHVPPDPTKKITRTARSVCPGAAGSHGVRLLDPSLTLRARLQDRGLMRGFLFSPKGFNNTSIRVLKSPYSSRHHVAPDTSCFRDILQPEGVARSGEVYQLRKIHTTLECGECVDCQASLTAGLRQREPSLIDEEQIPKPSLTVIDRQESPPGPD